MRRLIFAFFSSLFLYLAAIASAAGAFIVVHDHIRFVRVVSDSMAPKFHRGDMLLVKPVPTRLLRTGDIAMLPLVDGSGGYYTHRIISMSTNGSNQVEVKTKGDANPIPDDWKLTITSSRVPIYVAQLPIAGLPYIQPKHWLELTLFGLLLALIASFFIPARKPLVEEVLK